MWVDSMSFRVCKSGPFDSVSQPDCCQATGAGNAAESDAGVGVSE